MSEFQILFFCREGFESECLEELADVCQLNQVSVQKLHSFSAGLVILSVAREDYHLNAEIFSLDALVFSRQILIGGKIVRDLDQSDRISPILEAVNEVFSSDSLEPLYSEAVVTHSHAEDARVLQGFCKSVTRPFLNGLKRHGFKKVYSRNNLPSIHLVFVSYALAFVGLAFREVSSPELAGIKRLKAPKNAPSRSVLKLEEAFHLFLGAENFDHFLDPRYRAVDLGASPGGWSSLFVQHQIYVTAVDHGEMSPALMDTGFVNHVKEDAFRFEPKKNVEWLVCDMVEKPARVTELMCHWINKSMCRYLIFNLKLPMKKRYREFIACRDLIVKKTKLERQDVRAKHLYHDRQEITVFIDLRHLEI